MRTLISFVLSFSLIGYSYASSEADIATAERLMHVMKVDNQMLGGFEAILPIVNQMAAQLNLSKAQTDELKDIYRAWFNNDIDRNAIKTQIATLYANTFSKNEMEDIIDFFETPTGQKLITKTPEITRLGAEIGMTAAQNSQQQLMDRLQPFLEKHGAQ